MLTQILKRFLPALLCCYAASSQAFTYLPMTDESLLAQSPVVILGQVQGVSESSVLNRAVTEYQVAIEQVIKGEVLTNTVSVQVPGARRPTPQSRWVPGMPSFKQGDAVLLFLQAHADGSYGIMQLALGAFKLKSDPQGHAMFSRDLANAERLDVTAPLANAVTELPRDAESFLLQLGGQPELGNLLDDSQHQTANYTFLSTPPGRWFEFDEGQDVPFRAHSGGQPQMSGGGFNEIRNAINAWNNDPGSNIRYRYAGTTNASVGFTVNDGINAILFNDPNGEVDGSFDCQGGGVLAAGGFVSSLNTRMYNGNAYAVIQEADIVTNDGSGCFFNGGNGSNGAEIFGHELGHTLGLGHSCGDPILLDLDLDDCLLASAAQEDALMRAYPHADGRGSSVRADDSAGMAFLYEESGTPPTNGGGSGSGGTTTKKSGGGGGGCAISEGAPFDPSLWLLSLVAFAYLARRNQLARVSHQR